MSSDAKKIFLKKAKVLAFVKGIPDGQLFSVVFEKRDGTLRRMVCKQGVEKHLRGGEKTYNGANDDAGNLGVWDHEAGAYRCFNAERVVSIKGGGEELRACEVEEPVHNARGEVVNKVS